MADKTEQQTTTGTHIASDTDGATKKKRCNFCRSEWEIGAAASHRVGCPNVDTEK